ncbi:hypothetical protein HID58_047461 [Brassica napus]|uniref:(rape) hypothetical protein n=1 Tax=Brassica napus TaxID=3708 RepID=A0A816KJR6_BRANA|nr:hypothetical protein HID58_047461 [Brassica napus]CAF1911458.1 unnamed protein product [Brassica napus]
MTKGKSKKKAKLLSRSNAPKATSKRTGKWLYILAYSEYYFSPKSKPQPQLSCPRCA